MDLSWLALAGFGWPWGPEPDQNWPFRIYWISLVCVSVGTVGQLPSLEQSARWTEDLEKWTLCQNSSLKWWPGMFFQKLYPVTPRRVFECLIVASRMCQNSAKNDDRVCFFRNYTRSPPRRVFESPECVEKISKMMTGYFFQKLYPVTPPNQIS